MKRILKITGIVVLGIIVLMMVLPFVFKGKILEKVKSEINSNVNATVDFKSIGLNLFSSFPDFTLGINELKMIGKDEFENDTLAQIKRVSLTVDFWSVISNKSYEIENITITQPNIFLKVLKDGKANWDLSLLEDSTKIEPADTVASAFRLALKKVQIKDGKLVYDDLSLNTYVKAEGLNHLLKGDFTSDFSSLQTRTEIESLSVDYEKVRYLSNVNATANADIDADLKNFVFTLKQSDLSLNNLLVNFEGTFGILPNDDYSMNINFDTPSNDFKSFLSIIPALYHNDFNKLQSSGKLSFNGNIKGIYNDSTYPGFNININIENGRFKYESLPKPVEHISVIANIASVGGSPDNTIIDVKKFYFEIAQNPVEIKLLLKTPVSDPYIEASFNGKINLGGIRDFYPLENKTELSGEIVSDFRIKGNQSALDQKMYDQFQAAGSLQVNNLNYSSPDLTYGKIQSDLNLNFNPSFVEMTKLFLKIGSTNFNASGKIENYLPYMLSDGTLLGQLNLNSDYINVNDFIQNAESPPKDNTDTLGLTVVQIPSHIDFTMKSDISKVNYDNIEMKDLQGIIRIKDQQLELSNLSMNILDGKIKLSGNYDPRDIMKPEAGFDFQIADVDIQKAAATFSLVDKFAPVARKTTGRLSVDMKMNTVLDNHLMPVYQSVNGAGKLSTNSIVLKSLTTLDKLSDALQIKQLKEMNLNPVNLSFEIVDGVLAIKPFEIKYKDITSTLGGTTGLDQTINFFMNLNIPRTYFGNSANNILSNLVSEAGKAGANITLGNTIPVNALISGTLNDPSIKVSLKDAGMSLTDDLKNQALLEIEKTRKLAEEKAREELQKQKANVKAEAEKILSDARDKSDRLISEAKKKAQEIEKAAIEGSVKAKAEADKQAKVLIDEGKKNGFLAEAAAKKSAEKLKSESYKKADRLVEEAKKQGQNLVSEAQKKSDLLLIEANKKVELLNQGQ